MHRRCLISGSQTATFVQQGAFYTRGNFGVAGRQRFDRQRAIGTVAQVRQVRASGGRTVNMGDH